MKYFSLNELLFALPAALIVGAALAFAHALFCAILQGLLSTLELSNVKTAIKAKKMKYIRAEKQKIKNIKRLYFCLSEIGNCIFIIFFAVLLSVMLYIVSDGIPRGYIIIFTILTFFLISKLFRRPLDLIMNFCSEIVRRVLFYTLFIICFLPFKLHESRKKKQKQRKKPLKCKK